MRVEIVGKPIGKVVLGGFRVGLGSEIASPDCFGVVFGSEKVLADWFAVVLGSKIVWPDCFGVVFRVEVVGKSSGKSF